MPELPEVERARQEFAHVLVSTRLTVEALADNKVLANCSKEEFESALNGKKCVGTGRKGKNFWLVMESPPHVVMHFGMAGWFRIKGRDPIPVADVQVDSVSEWPPKYWKATFATESGAAIAFIDKRRFGRIRLIHDELVDRVPPISELGPDVADELPDPQALHRLLTVRKAPVKAVLLDQSVMSGIGNWVADEVLYHACIHPERRSSTLTRRETARLHDKIRYVITESVRVGAEAARFPDDWLFPHRWQKQKSSKGIVRMPSGAQITFVTVGGRTSAIVPSRLRKGAHGDASDSDELAGSEEDKPDVKDEHLKDET